MSNYPYLLDSILTLPTVSGSDEKSVAINALQDAVLSVEEELGIKPSNPYGNVRNRLDILESRLNFSIPSEITNDGYILSPLILWNTFDSAILTISDGYGVPTENRVNGSLYMRADGYANNDFYIRRDGYWTPIVTEQFIAAGDLTGNHLSQTVIGLRGKSLNSSLATIGSIQDGYHLTWDNADSYWRAETGFIAGGDLAILSGPWGRTGQTVIKMQGYPISSIAPTDGYSLVWVAGDNQWEPQVRSVIFDGYTTRTNLRSNKFLQSPIDNTKVGIINFGSRSAGTTVGATNNYSAILSGDRHVASGNFGLIVGGDSHIANAQYSAVLDGYGNVASGLHSTVLNGNTNIANNSYTVVGDGYNNTSSGVFGIVLDGYSNTSSGPYSVILDGYTNISSGLHALIGTGAGLSAAASYSVVLSGITNSIASGATHGSILSGSNNAITGTATYTVIGGGSGNTTSGKNVFIGSATNSNIQSDYSTIETGLNNIINSGSTWSTIINGTINTISSSSAFGTIVNGNNITVTGLYATVLNSTVASVNGLHSTILNGNTNNITGTFSTIGNGLNNTISGNPAYATILDGYSNTVSGSGSLVVDGYSNTVSGIWSTILNGNNNTISSANSTILNGSSNTIDVNSSVNTILFGTGNTLTNTTRAVVAGHGNTFTNVTSSYILGQSNNVQGTSIKITGNLNTVGTGANFNRIFGDSNTVSASATQNSIFGGNNSLINSTHDSLSFGSNNIIDGYGNGIILGMNNIANSNFGLVFGQYGKSRLFGQQVQANSRFTVGKVGEAQWSRVVMTGTSAAPGAAVNVRLQDGTTDGYIPFVDGYSYEIQARVLVVNTNNIPANPVLPARYIFDILAHQESGTLVIDHVNQTLVTPNTVDSITRTPWTVSINNYGNQLAIFVDIETATSYIQPQNAPSSRRAIATVEMREISRV